MPDENERDYTLIQIPESGDRSDDSNNPKVDDGDRNASADSEHNEHQAQPQDLDRDSDTENPPESQPDLSELAGLEPDDEDLLVGQESRLDSDDADRNSGRDISNSPLARTGLVGGTIGALVLVTLAIMTFFNGDSDRFAGDSSTPSTVTEQDDAQADRLRSRLALVDQQRTAGIENADASAAPPPRNEDPPPEPEPETEEPKSTPPPKRTVRRSLPELPPPPEPTVNLPRTIPTPIPEPRVLSPPPEPKVNPLQRWALLAQAGSKGSQIAFVPPVKVPEIPVGERTDSDASDAVTDDKITPSLQVQQQDETGQPDRLLFIDSNGQRQALTPPSTASNLRIPSETLGDNPYSGPGTPVESRTTPFQRWQDLQQPQGQTLSKSVSATSTTFISQASSTTQTTDELSPGERGILQRRRVPEDIPSSIPDSELPIRLEVALGTAVEGEIQVPIVAAPDGGTMGRFSVVLTEPMMSIDGQVALPQGTVLITQVQAIDNNSRAIQQTVVAAVYRDRHGRLRQEEIAPNILIIRGDDGGPLIASRKNANDSFFQDLLVGAFGAARNVGAIANRPNISTSSSASNGSSSTSTTVETSDDPDLVAAALEGFFGTTVERMQQRFSNAERPEPVLFVKSKKDVQVFANGFLSVLR